MSETEELRPPRSLRRILRALGMSLLVVVLIAAFYVAIVMGQPQDSGLPREEIPLDQPLLAALSAPVRITDSRDITRLAEVFPAPVMHAAHGSALVFVEGVCQDVPFEDGLGRTVTLTYRTEDFQLLTVQSLYPARALSLLMQDGYAFTGRIGKTLASLRSVWMQNAASYRMHAQGAEALYAFTCPPAPQELLNLWTSQLELYKAD